MILSISSGFYLKKNTSTFFSRHTKNMLGMEIDHKVFFSRQTVAETELITKNQIRNFYFFIFLRKNHFQKHRIQNNLLSIQLQTHTHTQFIICNGVILLNFKNGQQLD